MSEGTSPQETRKARNTVFRMLKYRPRSEYEIRSKLKQKKISESVVEETCQHFKKLALIDDKTFTKSWVRYRLNRPLGLNRIRFELRAKGIADEVINAKLEEARENYDEEETVSELAQHRLKKYAKLDPAKAKKRVYDYLLRRGFQPRTIIKVIKQL